MSPQEKRSASDGLPALVTGPWSQEKHEYIHRLATIFSTGMKNKWKTRCYVDLFAGPGRCIIDKTNAEVSGSPLLAADVPDRFTDYYFNDLDPDCMAALRQRLAARDIQPPPRFFVQNCNEVVADIVGSLPPARSSIELGVIDAWGWEMDFQSLVKLTAGRRMDLVITFPLGFIKRTSHLQLAQLDKFLGGAAYREGFLQRMQSDRRSAARFILDFYEEQLKKIGYHYFNDEIWNANSRRVKLYHFVFASKNPLGKDFWEKITKRSPGGQYRMQRLL